MKKLISVLLITLVLTLLLAACNRDNGTQEPAAPTPAPQEQEQPPAEPDESEPEEPEGFQVFTEGFPIVSEPITLTVFGQQGAVHADWQDMDVWIALSEKTGINFEFDLALPTGFAERRALMFASDDLPDMMIRAMLSNSEIVRHGIGGSLLALNDLLPVYGQHYYAHMQANPDIAPRITTPHGNIYALAAIITPTAARSPKMWLNMDWLAQTGLDVPTTIDEFETMLRAFRDLDHGPDLGIPFFPFGAPSFGGLVNYFAGSWGFQNQFGVRMNVHDGVVSTWVADDGFKDMLMWIYNALNDGLIDPEIFTHDAARWSAMMQSHRYGFFFNQADDAFDSTNFIGIAPFAGRSPVQYAHAGPIARDQGTFAISTQAEHPNAALRVVDYFFSREGSIFLRFGVEGVTWDWEDGMPTYRPGILDHPDGSGAQISRFTIWPGGGAPQWLNYENAIAVMSPTTVAAQEALNPFIPPLIFPAPLFDLDTVERLSVLQADLHTFIDQNIAQFARGERPFSEWDDYVATLYQIGLEEWVAIYQAALDTVMGR